MGAESSLVLGRLNPLCALYFCVVFFIKIFNLYVNMSKYRTFLSQDFSLIHGNRNDIFHGSNCYKSVYYIISMGYTLFMSEV